MTYDELNNLYKNNGFRLIDNEDNCKKFYLLRSISKSNTLEKFCAQNKIEKDLNKILENDNICEEMIIKFIREEFKPKTNEEIALIEAELNKMKNFDWGGSFGNNLGKNIVNNYVKKMVKYDDITDALSGSIQQSVYGYTLNSWYNHWSTNMIEELFNNHIRVLPTVDLIKNIDFFIDSVPFDLKSTYFPKGFMEEKICNKLKGIYGSKVELTCSKKIARQCNITIPSGLKKEALTICLYNLLKESTDEKAKEYLDNLYKIKKEVIDNCIDNPDELITWLYKNQGEMRFDAANRLYLVLIDTNNIYDSWKLKRNVNLIKMRINEELEKIDVNKLRKISFVWEKDGREYECKSEIIFIIK